MIPKFAFWRTPEARPHRSGVYDGKYAPDELLAEWGKTSLVSNGKVSWQGWAFEDLKAVLNLLFVVAGPDGELDEDDSWHIAYDALCNVALKLGSGVPIPHAAFISAADVLAEAFFQRPITSYVFVTSLSVGEVSTAPITINGCVIRPLASRAQYPVPAIVNTTQVPSLYAKHVRETRYRWFETATSGRTTNEAFNRAMDAIAILRASWTFLGTRGSGSVIRFGAAPPEPLAAVHVGPVHSLHHPTGAPISDEFFWRETDPRGDRQLFQPRAGWPALEVQRAKLADMIGLLPYGAELQDLFLRYIAALDHTNHDLAGLQLWSVLERITNTIGARYDDTIARASWIMNDRRRTKQILDCIRMQRNRFVHASKGADQSETIASLTKRIVEDHLHALCVNRLKVASLAQYADILALPTETAALESAKAKLKTAVENCEVALEFHPPPEPNETPAAAPL